MGGQYRGVGRPKIAARLRDDPEFRAEVEAARAWSTPPSIFRGRPWPAAGEPLWTDGDRDEATALLLLDWDTCSGCGQPLSESTDEDNDRAYTVDQLTCNGCVAREVYAEKDHYRGRMLRVRKR